MEDKYFIEICEKVYKELGLYHRERTYQIALEIELMKKYNTIKEYPLKIWYSGQVINTYFIDIVLDNKIPIECKTISKLKDCDRHQIKNYMINMDKNIGYLVNFGFTNLTILKLVDDDIITLIE